MSYEVAIVADSRGPNDARITTCKLKYPRMIHPELMTHRAFSRNASSTRAIPVARMLEWVEKDPAMPIYWGKNQKGMQATEELSEETIKECQWAWLKARDHAVTVAKGFLRDGVHKQIASRVLEPFAHINVIVTATSFDNFFALRCHPAAMPEIQKLAVMMARAYRDSKPRQLRAGEWHLPFVPYEELSELCHLRSLENLYGDSDLAGDIELINLLKCSVARCARVSYETFEGAKPDINKDIALHDQLRDNGHWSPFEHPAQARSPDFVGLHRSGNFVGWGQYRQTLKTSVHETFDYSILDQFGDRDFII